MNFHFNVRISERRVVGERSRNQENGAHLERVQFLVISLSALIIRVGKCLTSLDLDEEVSSNKKHLFTWQKHKESRQQTQTTGNDSMVVKMTANGVFIRCANYSAVVQFPLRKSDHRTSSF